MECHSKRNFTQNEMSLKMECHLKWNVTQNQCEEKSTTMLPMVGGKLSKSEESYPNARETCAPESVQLKECKEN